ncbi:MAG: glycosyltransferase family 39 protein [Caldilineaceae bacterium]|nr:glycosyltransferase family 39 protein [Caldilineaceae bacterium]
MSRGTTVAQDHTRRPNLYFLFILLIAAVLRFYCLSCSSLWHDEGNTWALMARNFAEIAAAAAADIHPPGYYWLLKAWTTLFGVDVWGLRSFSAILGVATVAVVHAIGRQIISRNNFAVGGRWSADVFPLLAAFLAAVNPFLIYYSQEARMYALLALLSAILFWAVMKQLAGSRWTTHYAIYFFAAAVGLWTHYSFPIVIAAAVAAYLWQWMRLRRLSMISPQSPIGVKLSTHESAGDFTEVETTGVRMGSRNSEKSPALARIPLKLALMPQSPIPNPQSPVPFLAVNALALLTFLPWLPTAVDRILSWPAGGKTVALGEGLRLTMQTFLIGPIRTAPDLAWPWLLLAAITPILGIWALRRTPAALTLGIWLLAPILLMFGLGLFSEAFLKFLIIAAPAWSLLTAAIPLAFQKEKFTAEGTKGAAKRVATESYKKATDASAPLRLCASALLVLLSALLSAVTLPGYYADPQARDNYAGIARTVAVLADPAHDLVILAAPGQREVWSYYDPGIPVLALPQERPPDRAATEASLAENTADRQELFAIFWALDEADPEGIVERWLDERAFKGLESWQGNVRFVRYSLPNGLLCDPFDAPSQFEDLAQLTAICRTESLGATAAGESLLIGLRWQALTSTGRRFKVTLQLLDHRNQVIAQRDGEPAGGSSPTVDWQPGDRIVDNHALYIPPGTPPGEYRLILALYDSETGARLLVGGADALNLGNVQIVPGAPLPVDILPIRHRLNAQLGAVTLIGYDAYRRGYAHALETPLIPGDLLHVTLYWQSPDPLPADWPVDLSVTLALGDQTISAPLAGGLYPTGSWTAGALVRGEFDIPYTGGDPHLWVQIGEARVRLSRAPVQ